MAFLAVENLHLTFAARSVLNGMSFAVAPGEVYGLVGPNGSGKSTTINVICGVLQAGQGIVLIGGVPATVAPASTLGVVPQEIGVYRDLTVLQNLRFFAAVYGLSAANARRRAAMCLEAVGLDDRADSLVAELSGGMQRRLHIGIALLHEPALLILDEPTVGLDLEIRNRVWDLILDLRGNGVTVLLTTHHLEEAERLCDRMGIVAAGRIALQGTLEELRGRVAAAELAVVESEDLDRVAARARELGLEFRRSHDAIVLWLARKMDIRAVAQLLGEVSLASVRLKPVGLEEVLAEVVSAPMGD